MDTTTPARPKAYSYLRFSTPEQAEGDSLRRQSSLAAQYAEAKGLDLDTALTFQDLGVSAYRGANAHLGRLAAFREALEAGQVPPGSFLLVESLDRISRDHAFDAQHLLSSIIMEGVAVVTLIDERLYSRASLQADPMGMMYSILGFMRANEESATKSRRLKESWASKREQIATRPLTSKCPAWLRLDRATGHFEPIVERAGIVQRVFALTLEGVGQHAIAERLNREGVATWGRGQHWQRSYIAKILANPAVVGTITPHMTDHAGGVKRRTALEAVEGYYPPVVTPETFADVQALAIGKRGPGRGASAGAPVSNVLAGLARCPSCGNTMTRVSKGPRTRPVLACVKAKAGAGCAYRSVPYAYVEGAILGRLWEHLAEVPAGGEGGDETEDAIFQADAQLDALREQAGFLLDNLSHERSPALAARLREVEGAIAEAEGVLAGHIERRDATSGLLIGARVARAVALLRPEGDGERENLEGTIDRAALNAALRGLFSHVVINWKEATLEFVWAHGGVTEIRYAMSTLGKH